MVGQNGQKRRNLMPQIAPGDGILNQIAHLAKRRTMIDAAMGP